ncbi:MAG: N-acetyl-gamma-glutamyl-phosphate reductase [Phaeodactylibacter sp.]|nr:N-acetyl-gamma-glutamyl-phosphate reductase [Phaeodactylibacter sp.]
MIRVGIIGGAGYTAGELLRILLFHPEAEVAFVQSSSQAGRLVTDVHTDLLGDTFLPFISDPDFGTADVIFLCRGHGKSKAFLAAHDLPDGLSIIDLSADYRLDSDTHEFVYGLPELNKEAIRLARYVANPGCFATAIQLALLPLAKLGLLEDHVHIHAITGSTGAGQEPTPTSHFSWRNNNVSVYKAFQHQHLAEIRQSILQLQPNFSKDLNFLPLRGNFARGIFASAYLYSELNGEKLQEVYEHYYQDEPFVVLSEQNPDLKQVVNTNKAILHLEKQGGKILIISMIDNLLKGAAGQAVQNMNLMFGLEETSGLWVKGVGF